MGVFGGINGTEMPFTNVLKFSDRMFPVLDGTTPFTTPTFPNSITESFQLDSFGWCASGMPVMNGAEPWSLGTKVFINSPNNLETGTYYVSCYGLGNIEFTSNGTPAVTVNPVVVKQFDAPNNRWTQRYSITVPAGCNGVGVTLKDSNVQPHHLRNVRMVHTDHYDLASDVETSLFHPRLLGFMDGLGNGGTGGPKVIRFGKWKHISSSQVNHWSDEVGLSYATYKTSNTKGGVPYDAILQLCEDTASDLWLQIPSLCEPDKSPNYLVDLGAHLQAWFGAGNQWPQRIYMEYTNENWNKAFLSQWNYALARFNELYWLPSATYPPPTTDPAKRAWFYAYASERCFDTLSSALGAEASRLKWVLGGDFANTTWTKDVFDEVAHRDSFSPGSLAKVHGFAVAPYLGAKLRALGIDWSFVKAWAAAGVGVQYQDPTTLVTKNAEVWLADAMKDAIWSATEPAAFQSLEWLLGQQLLTISGYYPTSVAPQLFAYEGGQGLTTPDDCKEYYTPPLGGGFVAGVADCSPTAPPSICPCQAEEPQVGIFYAAVNRDLIMESVYIQILDVWRLKTAAQPQPLFLAFDFIERYGKFAQGSWGVGEFLHEGGINPTPVNQAPKYKALVRAQQ